MKTVELQPNTNPLEAPGHLKFGSKRSGVIPRGLTFLAVVIILLMLAVIIGNIVIGGAGTLSWEFLSHPPEQGMEAGGVFPAIIGTVALVILMVIAVVPVGVFTAVYLQEFTSPTSRITRLIRIAPVKIPGIACGIIMRQIVCNLVPPRA